MSKLSSKTGGGELFNKIHQVLLMISYLETAIKKPIESPKLNIPSWNMLRTESILTIFTWIMPYVNKYSNQVNQKTPLSRLKDFF